MGLNIKNCEVERLAAEVASITGESKTEAIRKALLERRDRLDQMNGTAKRSELLLRWLEREVWPTIPPHEIGRRLSKQEEEAILGFGPQGV